MAPKQLKKVSQSDLRRLMKERAEKVGKKEEKIDSPLAKYDFLGRLSCIACNKEIKVTKLWQYHISSKEHKENVSSRLKRKSDDNDLQVPVKKKSDALSTMSKESCSNESHLNSSQTKVQASDAKTSLIQGYESSDEDEAMVTTDVQPAPPAGGLPSDFFDPASSGSVQSEEVAKEDPKSGPDALPEGFFDDPILDAKARNVEYKDPMEEEWEKFQKTMAEETNVSENIMVEDIEKSEVERDIDQIDEQIHNWNKVNALLSKNEHSRKLRLEEQRNKDEMMDLSEAEDEDFDYLLNWRAKGMWEKNKR